MDDALRCFDAVLKSKPTNLVALMGKVSQDNYLLNHPPSRHSFLQARILYAKRQYTQALRLFQDVLRYNPYCVPDPRIGIGLCLWAMDYKDKAKVAWQRSIEVVSYALHLPLSVVFTHPQNAEQWPAHLLLGLEAMNASKNENQTDEQRTREFVNGTRHIEKAFKANKENSAAANALCE